ncbi:hypothetical protein PanWU01x14_075410, partial [Parasponia andersonii]
CGVRLKDQDQEQNLDGYDTDLDDADNHDSDHISNSSATASSRDNDGSSSSLANVSTILDHHYTVSSPNSEGIWTLSNASSPRSNGSSFSSFDMSTTTDHHHVVPLLSLESVSTTSILVDQICCDYCHNPNENLNSHPTTTIASNSHTNPYSNLDPNELNHRNLNEEDDASTYNLEDVEFIPKTNTKTKTESQTWTTSSHSLSSSSDVSSSPSLDVSTITNHHHVVLSPTVEGVSTTSGLSDQIRCSYYYLAIKASQDIRALAEFGTCRNEDESEVQRLDSQLNSEEGTVRG